MTASYEPCDLHDRGPDDYVEAANDEPNHEREAEVDYVDGSGRKLFAIVLLDEWGTEALAVSVFDEDDNRVQCEDDVVDAIVQRAVLG